MKIGKIHNSKSMFLRMPVGTCKDESTKLEYDLSLQLNNNLPLVQSMKTGRWFSLSWEDVMALATQAGIDIPDEEPKSRKAGAKK